MKLFCFVALVLIASSLGQDVQQACQDLQKCVADAICPESASNSVEGEESASNSGERRESFKAMKECIDAQLTPEELAPAEESDCHPGKIWMACKAAGVSLRGKESSSSSSESASNSNSASNGQSDGVSNSNSNSNSNSKEGRRGKHRGSFPNALRGCKSVFFEGEPENPERKCKHDAKKNCMKLFGEQIVPGCSVGDKPECSERVADIIRGCKPQN